MTADAASCDWKKEEIKGMQCGLLNVSLEGLCYWIQLYRGSQWGGGFYRSPLKFGFLQLVDFFSF